MDITGDDYFNRISDMFKDSKNGKEEVQPQDKDSESPEAKPEK